MVKLIAAVSSNGVIGNNGDLVLTHKEDFVRFKKLTQGNIVLMGRKTWDSLPEKSKPLPNRENIVVSRNGDKIKATSIYGGLSCGTIGSTFDDFPTLLNHLEEFSAGRIIYIIGGGEIYKQTIEHVDELIITQWNVKAEGDIAFPEIDKKIWERKYIEYPSETTSFAFETWRKQLK